MQTSVQIIAGSVATAVQIGEAVAMNIANGATIYARNPIGLSDAVAKGILLGGNSVTEISELDCDLVVDAEAASEALDAITR